LNDGIFANAMRVQRDVARLLTDDPSVHLIAGQLGTAASFPALSPRSGGSDIASALMNDLQADPGGPLAPDRAAILRGCTGLDTSAFRDWWTPQFSAGAGTANEPAWLNIGAALETARLQHGDASQLALGSPAQCQAALRAGVSPDRGTDADGQLLRAVLDGWSSDVATPVNGQVAVALAQLW
jgi:hypothetical protein